MICLVIFDFDDTIVDNRRLDLQAFAIPFNQLGIPIKNLKKIHEYRKKGLLASDIANKLLGGKNSHIIDDFLRLRSIFLHDETSMNNLILKKNTGLLLNKLNRNKIRCILSTARSNKKMVIKFLIQNKIYNLFHSIILMEDLGFKIDNLSFSNRILIKNSLINRIIKHSKINPKEILFVGNSIEDLIASRKSRINFIYFQNTYLKEIQEKNIIKVKNMKNLETKINLLCNMK